LIASAVDASLYIFLECIGSFIISNNSGDGRSELYWLTHVPKSTGFEEHKIDGTRPNSLTAVVDESENCWSLSIIM